MLFWDENLDSYYVKSTWKSFVIPLTSVQVNHINVVCTAAVASGNWQ